MHDPILPLPSFGEFPGQAGRPDMHLVPARRRDETQEAWRREALRWRVQAVAEAVLGRDARCTLVAGTRRGAFHGLVEVCVPEERLPALSGYSGRVFLAAAGADAVLSEHPLVFVFGCLSPP